MLFKYQINKNKQNIINRNKEKAWFIKILIVLSIGFIPINIFPSGGFQLVDIIIILLIIILIFSQVKINNKVISHIKLIIPFIIWASIVNLSYYIIVKEIRLLEIFLNMIYIFLLLMVYTKICIEIFNKKNYYLMYISIILSIICVFSFKGYYEWEGVRSSLSFNNPNQLGLFALTILAITIFLMQYKKEYNIQNKIYAILDAIFIVIAHYLAFLAISRAALAAFIILDLCLLKNMLSKELFVPLSLSLLMGGMLLVIINPTFIIDRIEERGSDRFTTDAVKDRIKISIQNPLKDLKNWKIIYGTGQIPAGKIWSDKKIIYSGTKNYQEVHNMFGNVLWGYGIIGLILYGAWIIKTILEVKLITNTLHVWGALILYSMSGVLFRSRMFWLIIGIMMAMWNIKLETDKPQVNEDLSLSKSKLQNNPPE